MTETLQQRILSLEKHLAQQPKSPLFAQLASYYLDAGRTQDALNLCDKGLAYYPFYTTGHLIKGKTLLALNMRSEARREFEFVHEIMPLNKAVARLLAEIPTSSDEELIAPEPAPISRAKARGPEPPVEPAVIEQPPQEPAVSTAPAPESGAEQVLSQFTEPQPEVSASPASESAQTPEFTGPEQSGFAEPAPEVPAPSDDSFGLASPATEEPATADTFGQTTETPPDIFGLEAPGAPAQQPVEEGEPFEQYAERKRMELIGTENTLSLDEYLASSQAQPAASEPSAPPVEQESVSTDEDPFAALRQLTAEEPPPQEATEPPVEESPAQKDQIEELAEKLREAKRITPVINLSEKSPTPPSESETPAGSGFVTPTLAEIYAKQGWYDDAIKAYRMLAANKPAERDKFEKRIEELEELKKQQQPGE